MKIKNCIVFAILAVFCSCSKEVTKDDEDTCVPAQEMKLKKYQATYNENEYIETTWNSDGSIHTITMTTFYSYNNRIEFVYSQGRISEGIVYHAKSDREHTRASFLYNAAGRVDSIVASDRRLKLIYNGDKLVRINEYTDQTLSMYFETSMDARGNIIEIDEYENLEGNTWSKTSSYDFKRDDKVNPLAGLAPYMLLLDDPYNIAWHWGPNNYTEQVWEDHTDWLIRVTTGNKFSYNGNCYPVSSISTVAGESIVTDPSFIYTYY